MMVIIGWVLALAGIFGGYAAGGGHLAALMQPLEVVMIFGGAGGAFVAANTMHGVKHTLSGLASCFKGSKYSKAFYMNLLGLLFELLAKVRKEGLMSLENDVEEPDKSAIFGKYPEIMADHHVIEFITDYLRLMVGGNLNALEIENLMDNELETHHHEAMHSSHAVAKLADGMPAFGIVAAVMGVVHTMESLDKPPQELGILIAHALVGTFMGILLSYGFVAPLATVLEGKADEGSKVFQTIKVVLLASLNGFAPQVCVEFGRKVLFSTERPNFRELEEDIKSRKGK
ncbi:MAG: flagellar motor stator protein MotA [Hydrogenophilales bacterium CG03_land_8_20_14_0_80_62_28]|nr:flagellar motor stator protein MotA [Betaproteobacteria bacterium]OIO77630.1 MAG: flagellar motor stator protein MotA [Hydrogenophilaceae bacterium CG1_02_62_390]PIV24461.1 MAG: flagellar motor stator protein MotA [Hydrogenophilales bacterium CG03_land_8_20_14_0_80_62_28]PIW37862.1 MAG: flagellar motor stator protein MotA [Hydrogenophilales bacterium CG15_BIG_FIL_POST_REV_8_21_14_020_62_31]PIW70871.1 MAG: flagellar motor stator protein MotA [Hydrogenophilales bacterium CG12_big_fil_rev_8_21_